MIKRFAILLACLSFAVSAYGDGEIIETVRMTGGSYTYTNTARVPNWHLDCVALALPVTNANTLAVNHVRTLTVTDDPVAVVTTNAAGWVETNTWNVATRTDYAITNALLSVPPPTTLHRTCMMWTTASRRTTFCSSWTS